MCVLIAASFYLIGFRLGVQFERRSNTSLYHSLLLAPESDVLGVSLQDFAKARYYYFINSSQLYDEAIDFGEFNSPAIDHIPVAADATSASHEYATFLAQQRTTDQP